MDVSVNESKIILFSFLIIIFEVINPEAFNSNEITYNIVTLNFTDKQIKKSYITFEKKLMSLHKKLNLLLFFILISDIIYNTTQWLNDDVTESNIVFAIFLFFLFFFVFVCILEESTHTNISNILVSYKQHEKIFIKPRWLFQ